VNLRAGLIGNAPVWAALLRQEGFPWARVQSPDALDTDGFSVVIACGPRVGEWEEPLRNYVRRGGAAVLPQEVLARWCGRQARWERFRYLIRRRASKLRWNRLVEASGRGLVVEGAGELLTDKGSAVLPILHYGEGVMAAFPVDLQGLFEETRARRRLFYSPVEPLPSERVSMVPRGELRLMFHCVLEALHHERGIDYAHLWYFPGCAENIFSLRIDTDYARREEVDELYRLVHEFHVPASWFLHVKAHVGRLHDFSSMEGQEIGVHCYAHEAYGRGGLDRSGIEKARDLVEVVGLHPVGFAAPYGIWRRNLVEDLESLGFQYSSEFGLEYDNLPSYPWLGGSFARLLHVPVHPVTIGSLRREGYGPGEMIDYFDFVMKTKTASFDPLLFYVHPGDGPLPILRWLFERVRESGMGAWPLRDYAGWWSRRVGCLEGARIDVGEEVEVKIPEDTAVEGIRASVTAPDGRWALAETGKRTLSQDLPWRNLPDVPPVPGDVTRVLGRRVKRLADDVRTFIWRMRG